MSQTDKNNRSSSRGGKRLKVEENPRRAQRRSETAEAATATLEPVAEETVAAAEPAAPRRRAETARKTAAKAGEGFAAWVSSLWNRAVRSVKRSRRRIRHIAREKRAHNFPESERLPIQLILLVWGLLPAAASKLREYTWGRRRRAARRASQMWHWAERHRLHPGFFLLGGCAAAVVAVFFSTYTVGTTVTYDGEVVAVVDSQAAAEEVITNLEQATARTLGQPFTIDDSLIQYSDGWTERETVEDAAVLEDHISDEIGLVTSAYCLYVDGEYIGATPYEGALEELLEQMTLSVTNEDTISADFAEEVEIKQEYVPSEEIVNLGHLAETLYSTKTAEVTYEVKKGDTWSEIAEDHGLTSKELQALNPGYNINKLQIGEMLTLSASVPYLTLTVMQREQYVDDIPYNIEYTPTDDLYKGDYKVTSAGSYGKADVVATVTYVNGVETQRTILSSVTLEEPVTEHRLEGTKDRPTWHPTGTFRWPTSGRVTSYFGGRKSPGGIGSTNHKGLDIAAPKGTAIYAADGGIVTYSGWMGGYGYVVRINHNYNGYETFYAHNSKLLVSVGDKVYKGQQIAKMGSTGNSTGSHCHFEIRYNGVPKNPLNYLR